MRSPLLLSLLFASSAVLAQNQGVMILKSEQPYVSPFDKAPTSVRTPPVTTALPSTVQMETALQGEPINIEVREIDKKETEKRAQAFVASKPPQRALVRKVEPVRKKDDTRAVTKKFEPKALSKPAVVTVKEELKKEAVKDETATAAKPVVVAVKDESRMETKIEASVIPPKNAQNAKAELMLPPPALSIKDNKLTRFSKEAPLVPVASAAALIAPTIVPSEETLTGKESTSTRETMNNVQETDNFFPLWLLKAVMFFMIGGVLMSSSWYWIKRYALYGDPAFQDPWFHPVKAG